MVTRSASLIYGGHGFSRLLWLLLVLGGGGGLLCGVGGVMGECPALKTEYGCTCSTTAVHCENKKLETFPQARYFPSGVQYLYFTANSLSELDLTNERFSNLKIIDFSYNKLESSSEIGRSIHALKNLEELYLQNNKLQKIDTSYLHGTKIKILNLSSNPVDRFMFDEDHDISVEDFQLADLHFADFPIKAFKIFKKLETLDISGNDLPHIEDGTFSHNKDLKELHLNNNNFTTLLESVFDQIKHLRKIWLTDNPWNCDCSLQWLHDRMNEKKWQDIFQDQDQVRCSQHPDTALVDVSRVKFSSSGCHKLVKREVPDDPVYDPKITATDKTDISGSLAYATCVQEAAQSRFVVYNMQRKANNWTECHQFCFNKSYSYFVLNTENDCFCGDVNVNCTCACAKSYTTIPGAKGIMSGIKVNYTSPVVIGTPVTLALQWDVRYDSMEVDFGDGSHLVTTTSMSLAHTYMYPGNFRLKMKLCCSECGSCGEVETAMKVSSLEDEGRLVCDECVKLSESVSMNAKFSYGYNSEIVWSRTAEEDSATVSPPCLLGSKYSVNEHCYILYSEEKDWKSAKTNCTDTHGGSLAVVEDNQLSHFLVQIMINQSVSEAWIGLNKSASLDNYMWTNGNLFRGSTDGMRMECGYLSEEDTVDTYGCLDEHSFICEYTPNDVVSTEIHIAGSLEMEDTSQKTIELTSSKDAAVSSYSLMYMPGHWFTVSGKVLWFTFRAESLPADTLIKLVLYRPNCTSDIENQPGCGGNQFYSCDNKTNDCIKRPTDCSSGNMCYLFDECITPGQACSCSGAHASSIVCGNNPIVTGHTPMYTSIGHTSAQIPKKSPLLYKVKANIRVQPGDFMGVLYQGDKIPIKCMENTTSQWRHLLYTVPNVTGANSDIPTSNSHLEDQLCMINAFYSKPEIVPLPSELASLPKSGLYTFKYRVQSSGVTKTCNVTAIEEVGQIVWVNPHLVSSNIQVELNTIATLVAKVTSGSDLIYEWTIGGVNVTNNMTLTEKCPLGVDNTSAKCLTNDTSLVKPFTFIQHTFTSSTELRLKVSNKVSSKEHKYSITLGPCMPIQGLQLCHESCQTPSGCADPCQPLIEFGVPTFFPVMYTQGSADSTYTFLVNDTKEVGTTNSNRSITFTSTGFHRVAVNMTCGTHSDTAELGVQIKRAANVADLNVFVPPGVVIGEKFVLRVAGHVNNSADIEIIVDFGDGKKEKHVILVTSGSKLNQNIEYTYNTEKYYTIHVVVRDVFKNVSKEASLYALAAVSATARAEPEYAKVGQDVEFKIWVVPVNGSDVKLDSKMHYNWSFPAGVERRIESEVVNSTYKYAINVKGTHNISVSVSNLASTFYTYVMAHIQKCVTGLKLQYNGPSHINNTVNFTATIQDGTNVRYSMDPDNGSGRINQTNSTFLINFSNPGIYNTSVIAYNDLTSCALSREELTAYIIDDETLFLLDILPEKCLPSKRPDVLAAVAININPSGLNYTWDFGNGSHTSGVGLLNVSILYKVYGNYEVSISSKTKRFVKNVCIQEEITNLTIGPQATIDITPGESTMDNITTSVSTGSDITYVWTVNAGETAMCDHWSCIVELTHAGTYPIKVNASNNVSYDTANIVIEAQYRVINLTLTCLSCAMVRYQSTSKGVRMSAVAVNATDVSYRYNYGGDWVMDATHRFSNVSTYSICVNASNLVSDKEVCMDIVTEDEIESLTLTSNVSTAEGDFEVEVGTYVQFTVNYTKGTNVTFTWSCGDGLVRENEGQVFVCHFQQSKKHSFSVTAVNVVSSGNKSLNIYVLQEIISLNISQNLFQGRYAATNEAANFTAQSNTDLNVAYHWMVKSSANICEAVGKWMEGHCNDKHFTEAGLYNITLYANNSLNDLATYTEIEVMDRIKGLQIKFDANAISVNTSTVFTAEVTAGANLVYHWRVKCESAEVKDITTATMTHFFDKLGTCDISVNATSKLEPEGKNSGSIIHIEEIVSDIKIQSATQYVANGSEAVFDITRKSGSNLSLTWKLSGPGTTVDDHEVSLIYRFVHTGEYTLSVNASNRLNSDTDMMVIYVEEKVLSVNITVNKSLIRTATAIWFNAGAAPAGIYRYNWTINEEQCHTDADTFDKFFNNSGIYVVKVYVYNNVSFAVDSKVITVQEPISGLRVDKCESKVTGEEITITALITHGTDITYSWIYSSPDRSKSTAQGKDLTLDFEHEGFYHIELFAENNVSSEQINCTIKSQGKVNITNLVVKSDSKYNFVNQTIYFEVRGGNLYDINVTWLFNDSYVNKTVDKKLQWKFPSAGLYILTVIVNNDVSHDEKTQQFYIHVLDCELPKITVINTLPGKVLRSQSLDLAVDVNSSNCTEYQSQHEWQVFRAPSCSSLTGKIDLGNTNSPTLHLQARTLPSGSYCVVFNTSYLDTFVYETVNVNFTVVSSELVAVIAGGSGRVVSQNTNLSISCLDSSDPDMDATALSCNWTCISTTSEPCPWKNREDSNFLSNFSSGEYTLNLTVTDATSGRTATTSQMISVVPEAVPSLSIKCLSCSESGSINAYQQLVLTSQCSNCQTDANYTWILEVDGKPQTLTDSQTLTTLRGPNLVIKQGVIPVGSDYTVTVSKSFRLVSRTGSSSLKLHGNKPPSGGTCTVTPTTVQTLANKVKVSCSGWSDSDNTAQLFYKVIAKGTSSMETYQVCYGVNRDLTFYLASSPGSDKVTLEVQVIDNEGAYTSTTAGSVTVRTPANMTDYIFEQAQSALPALIKQNKPSLLLPYVIALSQELNHESDVMPSILSKEKRATVRDAITITLMTIPVTILEDVQQVAYLLQLLTKYFDEYQTESCHLVIVESLKNITNVLQANAFQGRNQEDFVPHHLLATISNLIEAVNLGVYNPDAVSGWETYPIHNFYKSFINLRPEISSALEQVMSSHSPTFTATDVKHRRTVVPSAFEIAEQIMTTILMTTMWMQDSMVINLGGIEVHGQRSKVKEIWSTLELEGCEFHLPPNLFQGIIGEEEEIFQIMFVLSKNPFTWGYINNMTINSRVPSLSFKFNNGKAIPLQGLPESKHINMFMFENVVQSNKTQTLENSSLFDSIYYKPLANLDYTTDTVKRSKAKRVNFDVSNGADGASGLHIQVRMDVVANTTDEEEGVVPQGSLKVYLGDNILPTKSTYTDYKLISTSDMADKVDHRNYTFFITSDSFKRKRHYTLSVYNEDAYHDINISIAIYFSSCQFFNTDSMNWDNNGCQVMDVSITTRTACRCNHLTSFGSSMLVPPSAINIVDLVNLDLSTNPVVMIAISMILFVYMVVVLICRKLDRMDLQRVTRIPLCGKMGLYKYEVTVVTGRKMGAGTTAHIGIKLYGEDGKGEMRHLTKPAAFQRNCTDKFLIAYDTRLGDLKKILIWHDNTGLSPSWYLSHVIVKDLSDGTLGHGRTYYFVGNAWLSVEMEPGLLKKEIPAANELAIQTFSNTFKMAASHGFADKHLWMSLMDRHDHSRFTRVQRASCCVTVILFFMMVNAIWYGIIKTSSDARADYSFSWEEVVIGLVSNVVVFPVAILLVFLFKSSRSKNISQMDIEDTEIEIPDEEEMDFNDFDSYYCGESTTGAIPGTGLKRTQTEFNMHVALSEEGSILSGHEPSKPPGPGKSNMSISRMWDPLNILNWAPDKTLSWKEDRASTAGTTRGEVKKTTSATASTSSRGKPKSGKSAPQDSDEEFIKELDQLHEDLTQEEAHKKKKRAKMAATKKSNGKTSNKVADDLFCSDEEWATEGLEDGKGGKSASKKTFTKTPARAAGATAQPRFNPREDPKLRRARKTSFHLDDASTDDEGGKEGKASKQNVQVKGQPPPPGKQTNSKEDAKKELPERKTSTTSSILKKRDSYGRAYSAGSSMKEISFMKQRSIMSEKSKSNMSAIWKRNYYSSTNHTTEYEATCMLPSWCVYVAYGLSLLISVVSIIIVLLYGYQFGSEVSLKWLLSLFLAFICSALVIEPTKVLLVALYLAARSRDVQEEIDKESISIPPVVDNVFETFKDVKFRPLGGFALMHAKEEGVKIQRMHVMLRQFVSHMFLLSLLLAISFIYNGTTNCMFSQHVQHLLHQDGAAGLNLSHLRSIPDFRTWTETVLADTLHRQELNPQEQFGVLLGPARLRQIRGTLGDCPISSPFAKFHLPTLTALPCEGNLGYTEDTNTYGEAWSNSIGSNVTWRYFTATELHMRAKYGHDLHYSGGGYVMTLGNTYNETLSILSNLFDSDWINLRTRAVFAEFTLYSAAADLTTTVTVLLEFPLSGGALSSQYVSTLKLLRFLPGRVDPLMVCEVLFLLCVIYLVVHLGLTLREERVQFVKQFWNWLDLVIAMLAVVCIGLYIACVVTATDTFGYYTAHKNDFTNFEMPAHLHDVMRMLHAWLLFLIFLKIVRQLRFFPMFHAYGKTISNALGKLAGCTLIFLLLLMSYAQLGYLYFGMTTRGFASFQSALLSLMGVIRGSFDFWHFLHHWPVMTHFYFYSFYAFAYGLFIGLVIAVVLDTYKITHQSMFFKSSLDTQDHEMIEFMMKRFKLWAGITKQKPAFRSVRFKGHPSLPSRASSTSRRSSISSSLSSGSDPLLSEEQALYLEHQLDNAVPRWEHLLNRFDRIEKLEVEEDHQMKKIEKEIKGWETKQNSPKRKLPVKPKSTFEKFQHNFKGRSQFGGKNKQLVGRTSVTPPTISPRKPVTETQEVRPHSYEGERSEAALVKNMQEKKRDTTKNVRFSKPAW
ncbi:polycystin-1-like [Haliotis cracherodii]|uniref:polycystin-1-like n=1 Tax=Haliotis cracherodii TaxID=6455 RepID=UPI0039ED439B